jgi:hypothetical protein
MPFFRIMCAKTRKLVAVVPALDTTTAMCIGCALFGPDIYVEKLAAVRTQSIAEKLVHDIRVDADINRALEIRAN